MTGALPSFAEIITVAVLSAERYWQLGVIGASQEQLVWCGVVWCGVVWCRVVWSGVVWGCDPGVEPR